MAEAGDGNPRSRKRKQTSMINLRCTSGEKAALERKAERLGFSGLSAWIKDLMHSHDTVSLHLRRIVSGRLGQIGARIAGIIEQDISEDISRELSAVSKAVAQLQTDMIRGDIDACESDI